MVGAGSRGRGGACSGEKGREGPRWVGGARGRGGAWKEAGKRGAELRIGIGGVRLRRAGPGMKLEEGQNLWRRREGRS